MHTSGPWKFTDDFIAIYDEKCRCIANMDSESAPEVGLKETLANAQLIAAAPELLEACKAALNSGAINKGWKELRLLIDRAIAKAEGRS